MNNYQTGNIKLEKLAKENSAFQNCQPDMSDVNFEICLLYTSDAADE